MKYIEMNFQKEKNKLKRFKVLDIKDISNDEKIDDDLLPF